MYPVSDTSQLPRKAWTSGFSYEDALQQITGCTDLFTLTHQGRLLPPQKVWHSGIPDHILRFHTSFTMWREKCFLFAAWILLVSRAICQTATVTPWHQQASRATFSSVPFSFLPYFFHYLRFFVSISAGGGGVMLVAMRNVVGYKQYEVSFVSTYKVSKVVPMLKKLSTTSFLMGEWM